MKKLSENPHNNICLFPAIKKFKWLSACTFLLLLISCKKSEKPSPQQQEPVNTYKIRIIHEVDNNALILDTLNYVTQAGQPYSVTSLNYYLSNVCLIKPDSTLVFVTSYHYCDAARNDTRFIDLSNLPAGNYIGIKSFIGLDSIQNSNNSLPSNEDNINMQWPEPMGGGYHFLKLEGHYKDNGQFYGYAMHIGTNKCLMSVAAYKNFSISSSGSFMIDMVMNVNEWFRNPYTYNFNNDGNYIMGNDTAMMKIANNGTDVFSLR